MTSSTFETDEMRPIQASCTDDEFHVSLIDGRFIATPPWRYPFPASLNLTQSNDVELMYDENWWPAVGEGISVKSLFLGKKALGAVAPSVAAE